KIVEQYPIATVPLDKIEGLPGIDWLILNARHDADEILESGKTALQDSLLIQVRVCFQPTHQRQLSLDEISHWASRNGFRFYRFLDLKQREAASASTLLPTQAHTETDAIFIPNPERLNALPAQ